MLRNYTTTALRNIQKNKLTSFITIIGFSVGIAVALFIFLYAQYEFSFDRFLPGHDRIYRLLVKATTADETELQTSTISWDIKKPLLSRDIGIEHLTQIGASSGLVFFESHRYFERDNIFISDSSFLKVFGYPLAIGERETALVKPMSVILTRDAATKYFGRIDPVGKSLGFSSSYLGDKSLFFTVTGVLENPPADSSLRFDFVMNLPTEKFLPEIFTRYNRIYGTDADWRRNNFQGQTFVILKNNAFLPEFRKGLDDALDAISKEDTRFLFKSYRLTCESLDSLHLFSKIDVPSERKGDFLFILFLSGLGIIVIVIACINVMNLATARAMTRAKEIGIRKALGASRKELRLQCLVESMILSFISLWFALVLVELCLPFFGYLMQRDLIIDYLGNRSYLLAMVALTFFVGLLSGLYPAIYLSAFEVIPTLRDQKSPSSRRFREVMVVIQFVFAIGLFIASAVILREFRSIKQSDPGFNAENIVMARLSIPEVERSFPEAKKAIADVPGVLGVSASSFAGWKAGDYVRDLPVTLSGKIHYCDLIVVDPDYLNLQEIRILRGWNFVPSYDDSYETQVIINESARRELGCEVGTGLALGAVRGRVIGVAKDFNYLLPVKKVKPLVLITQPFVTSSAFAPRPIALGEMLIKIQDENRWETIARIEVVWGRLFPGYPLEVEFMDEGMQRQLDNYYHSFEGALDTSTVISFLLSALGLFGLASFETERRTKEIGIRKALGATSMQIVAHFLGGFLKLVALANLIAWPATFVLIRTVFGLLGYPRPLPVGPVVFLEAGVVSVVVMALTVGVQTLRAASRNPVDTLRYE